FFSPRYGEPSSHGLRDWLRLNRRDDGGTKVRVKKDSAQLLAARSRGGRFGVRHEWTRPGGDGEFVHQAAEEIGLGQNLRMDEVPVGLNGDALKYLFAKQLEFAVDVADARAE